MRLTVMRLSPLALANQPLMPLRPGQLERRTHDYKRLGTTSLFAARRTHQQTNSTWRVSQCKSCALGCRFLPLPIPVVVPINRLKPILLGNYHIGDLGLEPGGALWGLYVEGRSWVAGRAWLGVWLKFWRRIAGEKHL
jgi:hypothetical protein